MSFQFSSGRKDFKADGTTIAATGTLSDTFALKIPDTKGDILTYDGTTSAIAELAVGSNGQVLTADSTADKGIKWTNITGFLMGEDTTTGNETTLSVSGLDLDTDKCYRGVFMIKNAYNGGLDLKFGFNGDTTAGNYSTQEMYGVNTTATIARTAFNNIYEAVGAYENMVGEFIVANTIQDRPMIVGHLGTISTTPTATAFACFSGVWESGTNVSSIQLYTADASRYFTDGSWLKIYKQ